MNEYIFYTAMGQTEAPNENVEVENCQVIGCAKGNTKREALLNLLKENSWITDAGFIPSEFIVRQLLTDGMRDDIRSILEYLWKDGKIPFEKLDDKNSHILLGILKRLAMAVALQEQT